MDLDLNSFSWIRKIPDFVKGYLRLLKVTSARKVFKFLKKCSGYLDFYDFFCETHRTKVGDVIIDISV